MQALIIKQDGKVYYIADLPYRQKRLEYGIAIQSAIIVKNQEYSVELINNKYGIDGFEINVPLEFQDLNVRIVKEKLEHIGFCQTLAIIEEEKGEDEKFWKELRNQFFTECTDIMLYVKKINMAPHDLFEWFKTKITKR